MQTIRLIGEIQAAAIPALQRRVHQRSASARRRWTLHLSQKTSIFRQDPNVDNDVPVVRHNREEEIILVWSGMTMVLLFILYQVWSA